jgi:hypothetical protein
MEKVYELENRGYQFIYHWFFLTLAGLRHLEKPGCKVKVYMPWYKDLGYHNDSLPYFSDKFEFLCTSNNRPKCPVEFFHGESLIGHDRIATDGYLYVREALLRNKTYEVEKGKRVYITRTGSASLESNRGNLHHAVLNEADLVELLTAHGFTVVHLEELNLEQKIALFRTAEVIVAPFGGGLTFTALCEPWQNVIELVSPRLSIHLHHYRIICEELGVPYTRFEAVYTADDNLNIHVDIDKLRGTLASIL